MHHQGYPTETATRHGSRSYNVANSSTLPPPTSPTIPSEIPRCRLQTSSGYASASSRNGQCMNAMSVVGARGLGGRLESEAAHLGAERLHARPRTGALAGLGPPLAADLGGLFTVGADPFGERGEQPGEQGVAGRIETQARARRVRASRRGSAGRRCRGARPRPRRDRLRGGGRGAAEPCWRADRACRPAPGPNSPGWSSRARDTSRIGSRRRAP